MATNERDVAHTDDLTDDQWKITETRAALRDLASDQEIEELFARYRHPS